jgi:hypothetical protein
LIHCNKVKTLKRKLHFSESIGTGGLQAEHMGQSWSILYSLKRRLYDVASIEEA